MRKHGILNARLAGTIARLGHTDQLVVCDAGLPIPRSAEVVDLALTRNVPSFVCTVDTIVSEMVVESAVVAQETADVSPQIYDEIKRLLPGIPIRHVSHEEFKQATRDNADTTFVRTGEMTPFANIILIAGVDFS
jgi:D-ribose pyranase